MAAYNPIKKLASETAIYGLSTILARMINFFFVPYYTRVLTDENYGCYTAVMAYVAVLQVVLVFGLETGCFKFASNIRNKEAGYEGMTEKEPFSTSFVALLITSGVFLLGVGIFAKPLSTLFGEIYYPRLIVMIGGFLAIDAITSVLFAQLRFKEQALKFTIFKAIKIISEMIFNIVLFLIVPGYLANHPSSILTSFIPPYPDFSYIIFAIFLSSILCLIIFIPDILRMGLQLNWKLLRRLLVYSLPIMIACLPGILNESTDRLLFGFFAPEGCNWREALGVYGAALKLAIIMNLAIQMFRYAAEPFFFSKGKNTELLASVMEYFVAFCMMIFLGTMLFFDEISLILGKDFRSAIWTVPFMLLSYMVLGMLFNVSMWYKLSGKTKVAIPITLLGLFVTVVINIVFMPLYSYWASVAAHLVSVVVMLIFSVHLGNKYYPIPYKWGVICKYIAVGIFFYLISYVFGTYVIDSTISWENIVSYIIKVIFNILLFLLFVYYCAKKTGILSSVLPMIGKRK